MGLVVSSDESGCIKIWSVDKKFIREIQLPHQVDSVCFLNSDGDLLISHEKRVSKLEYKMFKSKIFGYVMTNRHLMPIERKECSDVLFWELK